MTLLCRQQSLLGEEHARTPFVIGIAGVVGIAVVGSVFAANFAVLGTGSDTGQLVVVPFLLWSGISLVVYPDDAAQNFCAFAGKGGVCAQFGNINCDLVH